MFGANHRASTRPPCISTSGSPSPCSSYQVRTAPSCTYCAIGHRLRAPFDHSRRRRWDRCSMRPGRLDLGVTRLLPAPPARVFEALTRPDDVARWWGPRLFTTPEIELDLRVGGRFRFTMQPPGGDRFHLSGEFREIPPPSSLAYTFRWDEPTPDDRETVVALTMEAVADAVDVAVRQGDFATEERVELHRAGWTDSLDKLSALVTAAD